MKYLITGAGADKGEIHDVEILAKKFNGCWVKYRTSVGFVCYDDIRVLEMSDDEKAMPVYMKPGYPGKEDK